MFLLSENGCENTKKLYFCAILFWGKARAYFGKEKSTKCEKNDESKQRKQYRL